MLNQSKNSKMSRRMWKLSVLAKKSQVCC